MFTPPREQRAITLGITGEAPIALADYQTGKLSGNDGNSKANGCFIGLRCFMVPALIAAVISEVSVPSVAARAVLCSTPGHRGSVGGGGSLQEEDTGA